jgi:predicted phage terminase large subunit-like protein
MLAESLLTSYGLSPTRAMRTELREAARLELARRQLLRFVVHIEPTYQQAPHLELTAQYLERARRREIKRLMIFEPPRHGKSKLVSEMFPAWALGLDPQEQFMLCTHTQGLSDTFSRNVRNVIAMDAYHELFPGTRLSADSATVQRWTLDGFTRPAMLSMGVGGSPVGQGARILIIDDPIGDAAESESLLQRDHLYQWYTDTIYPRLEPNAVIILMMQRWHEDDLAGRLLNEQRRGEKWTVLNLPALALENDPLQRAPGEALWPERFGREDLHRIRGVNTRSFEAKYQQMPRPAEGALFKRNWFRIVEATPTDLKWVRYYDLAYSQKQQADNTATIAGALGSDGTLYLRRGRAGKLESPDQRKLVKAIMLDERETRHGIEKAIHGGPLVQDLMRDPELAGISFAAVDIAMNQADRKFVLARPVADRAEMGKVAFVRESVNDDGWIEEWINEMCAFPYGLHDDRVDAVSGVNGMIGQGDGKKTRTATATVVTVDQMMGGR